MKTELANSIIAITEAFLPRSTRDKILCISVDARVHDWLKQKEISSIRGIHIAIYRPSNYTKVVMAVNHDIAFTFDQSLHFEYKSDHDSCWRDDGLRSPLFNIKQEMVEELCKKGANPRPFDDYSWFVGISSIKIIPGSINVDRNNNYSVTFTLNE